MEVVNLHGWAIGRWNIHALITSKFIHYDFYHLFFNMLYLWVFGAALESVVGWPRFLAYYLAGGVFGSLLHSSQVLIFSPELADVPSIGASGAISAIMGVFIVRCYFSKIKVAVSLFVPFIVVPRRFKVGAFYLLAFYFAMDLYHGISTAGEYVGIGYWAHIGGFVFGAVASLASCHIVEARLDQKRQKSGGRIEEGIGLAEARRDLEAIISKSRDDGKALWELARIETRYRLDEHGKALYRRAVMSFWKKRQTIDALLVFDEMLRKHQIVFTGPFQLALCRELIKRGNYDLAARALETLIKNEERVATSCREQLMEQSHMLLGKLLADRLGCRELAVHVFRTFLEKFPRSDGRDMVERKIRLLTEDAI